VKPYETFYASAEQQPVLLWCAAAVGLAVVALNRRTSRSTRAFCLLLGIVPLLDAWLTADPVMGVGSLGPTAGVVVATVFVIVGDLRFFLFLTSATEGGEIAPGAGKAVRATLLSLVVPIATAIFRVFLPDATWKAQATYLFYEIAFLLLTLTLRALGVGAMRFAWGRRVTRYVLVYYALWALADVMILFLHADAGYLLRVAPNVLYYGGLLAAVSLSSPAVSRPSPTR
jgi:hypothetical protein